MMSCVTVTKNSCDVGCDMNSAICPVVTNTTQMDTHTDNA